MIMVVDTGKANISLYNQKDNIILVDIYADGELVKADLDQIHVAIEQFDISIPVTFSTKGEMVWAIIPVPVPISSIRTFLRLSQNWVIFSIR